MNEEKREMNGLVNDLGGEGAALIGYESTGCRKSSHVNLISCHCLY